VASDRERNFEFLIVLSIIYKTIKSSASTTGGNFYEFKIGGLHEKHAVQFGIWEPSQHLLEDRGKPRKPVSRWPVAGPSGCIQTTSRQSGKQKREKKYPLA
jgi:hypothetical protein